MSTTKSERMNIRLTPEQDALLKTAADASGTPVSEFTVTAAVRHAETMLTERLLFPVDEDRWDYLQRIFDESAQPLAPRLQKLLTEPSVFE
jgi:uncharacterized protein (DUF1778 family)